MLLSFWKTGALNEKELNEKLKEYVTIAATSRNNTLKADTNSLNALLYTLNDTAASSKIKDSFIEVLGIDKNKDIIFDKTKTFDENISKFKFTKQNLESFITKSKSEAPKIQSKHSVATSHVSRGELGVLCHSRESGMTSSWFFEPCNKARLPRNDGY